jgi:phospholipase C
MRRILPLILAALAAVQCTYVTEEHRQLGASSCCTGCSTDAAHPVEAGPDALVDVHEAGRDVAVEAAREAGSEAAAEAGAEASAGAGHDAALEAETSAGGAPGAGGAGAGGTPGAGGAIVVDPCANGVRDGAETDIDCGGGTCPACAPGYGCLLTTDCQPYPGDAAGSMRCVVAPDSRTPTGRECNPIDYLWFVVQENRTFDNYFWGYPGADSVAPAAMCAPDPRTGTCVAPFETPIDSDSDCPHLKGNLVADLDGGALDGFVQQDEIPGTTIAIAGITNASPIVVTTTAAHGFSTGDTVWLKNTNANTAAGGFHKITVLSTTSFALDGTSGNGIYSGSAARVGKVTRCSDPQVAGCNRTCMGHHPARQAYTLWAAADWGVLHDRMFEGLNDYSAPSHAAIWSGAIMGCPAGDSNPMHCTASTATLADTYNGAWTDVSFILHRGGVSWRYYRAQGAATGCRSGFGECPSVQPNIVTAIWNAPAQFIDVDEDGERDLDHNPDSFARFYADTASGGSPAHVNWIAPGVNVSEHPTSLISSGQNYLAALLNRIGGSPIWQRSAVFVFYDDTGGFFDHVPPPTVDAKGYGMRVPSVMISPYARAGFVDHQVLSFDAHLKLAEDIMLDGQRIDPLTDGRPDPRTTVRENAAILGDLLRDFDFRQAPRSAPFFVQH